MCAIIQAPSIATGIDNPSNSDIDITSADVQDESEFLLDTGDSLPVDMDAVLPSVKASDNAMDIDEEGRPKFAPARDIVSNCAMLILL